LNFYFKSDVDRVFFPKIPREPKPKFSAIFPLHVSHYLFWNMTRGQNRPNTPDQFVYIVFPFNSFENAIYFVVFSVLEILEDQGRVQGLL
jgi:hypothetical protein